MVKPTRSPGTLQVGVAALVLGVADPIWPSDCLISIQHLGRERRNSQTLVNKYDKNQTFAQLARWKVFDAETRW